MSETQVFKQKSAELILSLYETRREPELRAARAWWITSFHPTSAKDILRTWTGRESAAYRMVTTYWEMAATFVTSGAIDAGMFHAANTEYLAVYAKLRPFLTELRELAGYPKYLEQLERLVMGLPDADARLDPIQRYLARQASLATPK